LKRIANGAVPLAEYIIIFEEGKSNDKMRGRAREAIKPGRSRLFPRFCSSIFSIFC
jgi:hypothetical protein